MSSNFSKGNYIAIDHQGEHTVTLDKGAEYRPENSAEAFTASFAVDDETAIRSLSPDSPTPDPSYKGVEWAGAAYDLSGRRIAASSLPRGIYIKDGRKVVIR